MGKVKLTALPCLCVDVFDGTGEIRPGGEELNFAVHASQFEEIDVTLIGAIGDDEYGKTIMNRIADKKIHAEYVRVDSALPTANNYTYLTDSGDRYYKEDSWNGTILEQFSMTEQDIQLVSKADVVVTHFFAACFKQIVELKKSNSFKLAVDFDVYRDFDDMEQYAPYIDFFMISGKEELLHYFKEFSKKYKGLFNMSLGADGSVTYNKGVEYRVNADKVDCVLDTTGCGDSYHAGFVCSYLLDNDIRKAMKTGSHIAAETLSKVGGF